MIDGNGHAAAVGQRGRQELPPLVDLVPLPFEDDLAMLRDRRGLLLSHSSVIPGPARTGTSAGEPPAPKRIRATVLIVRLGASEACSSRPPQDSGRPQRCASFDGDRDSETASSFTG